MGPHFYGGAALGGKRKTMNFYEDHQREGRLLTWLGITVSIVLLLWIINAKQ